MQPKWLYTINGLVPNPDYREEYIDKYYPNGYKGAKPMRNVIVVNDKNIPPVRVVDLETGQMFRYPAKTNPNNVYMVVNHALGRAVVLLASGVIYSDFRQDAEIEVVDNITIYNPIK